MNYISNFGSFLGKYSPIGVFDSGYGGLTILKELKQRHPDYDFIYLGDNSRSPYGNLSDTEVINNSKQAISYLFNIGCCEVIIACNTASSKKELIGKNIISIITPTLEQISKFDNLGVLATTSTVNSGVYNKPGITQKDCPLWVSLIESGYHKTKSGEEIIKKDLQELFRLNPNIKNILLACTHFNLVKDIISKFYPQIRIITQDKILADYLSSDCSKNGTVKYLTTEDSNEFDSECKDFIGMNINSERVFL